MSSSGREAIAGVHGDGCCRVFVRPCVIIVFALHACSRPEKQPLCRPNRARTGQPAPLPFRRRRRKVGRWSASRSSISRAIRSRTRRPLRPRSPTGSRNRSSIGEPANDKGEAGLYIPPDQTLYIRGWDFSTAMFANNYYDVFPGPVTETGVMTLSMVPASTVRAELVGQAVARGGSKGGPDVVSPRARGVVADGGDVRSKRRGGLRAGTSGNFQAAPENRRRRVRRGTIRSASSQAAFKIWAG